MLEELVGFDGDLRFERACASGIPRATAMVGGVAANFHEGSRSEYLAHYALTSWGTAVAVPHHEDHGLDFYCTLTERVGKTAWAKSPYTVQVKSSLDPWIFDGVESVRWLVQHPLPLYLCAIEKSSGRIRFYHTFPRFFVWSQGSLPEKITLIPSVDTKGHLVQWSASNEYSLGAPIIDIAISDLVDDAVMASRRNTLEYWIEQDSRNLTFVDTGLLRFQMPNSYETNGAGSRDWCVQGRAYLDDSHSSQLQRAILHLSSALNCIGGQLHNSGDLVGSTLSALLLHHFVQRFPDLFEDQSQLGAVKGLFELVFVLLEVNQRIYRKQPEVPVAGISAIRQLIEQLLAEQERIASAKSEVNPSTPTPAGP